MVEVILPVRSSAGESIIWNNCIYQANR